MTSRWLPRWIAVCLTLSLVGLAVTAWAAEPCRVCRETVTSADGRETMTATVVWPTQSRERHKHVLVLLHGLGGDATSWLQVQQVRDLLDDAMRSGTLPPTLLILPDGGDGYWADWQGGSRHFAALVLELVKRHATPRGAQAAPSPETHAIVGASMGGFGALSIALQHPEVFGTAIALSATDLDIAVHDSPKRQVYRNVLGPPPWTKALARINPLQLVRSGAGKGQRFWLGWGSAEARKFAEGGKLLAAEMRTAALNVETKIVEGGVHGWASTWHQLHPWWIDGLIAQWRVPVAPIGAATAATAAALSTAQTRTGR